MLTLRSPYFDSNTTLQMYEILLLSMDPRLRGDDVHGQTK
jgi:hypothetical protein